MLEQTQTILFRRRRLPHWMVADRPYFVTLCRKGSLPARVLKAYRAEREALRSNMKRNRLQCCRAQPGTHQVSQGQVALDVRDRADGDRLAHAASNRLRGGLVAPALLGSETESRGEHQVVARNVSDRADGANANERAGSNSAHQTQRRQAESRRRFLEIDAILDAAARGDPVLCVPSVAESIIGNYDWLRNRGWRIWAATLMPSHLHMVLRNRQGRNDALCSDLALFMSYTARRANTLLGRSGAFWQSEPFDHWCRDPEAWQRSVSYTLQNPVKAGLCDDWRDWPHSVTDPEVEAVLS